MGASGLGEGRRVQKRRGEGGRPCQTKTPAQAWGRGSASHHHLLLLLCTHHTESALFQRPPLHSPYDLGTLKPRRAAELGHGSPIPDFAVLLD